MGDHNIFTCCICGQKCRGWGNDPFPVVDDNDAECCDACNATVVVPARLKAMSRVSNGR